MANDIDKLIAFYKAEICDYIDGVKPYQPVEQLKQFASLFSPGLFYFYVINFANLCMEYVDPGCRTVLGVEPEDLDVPNILSRLSPEELAAMTKKEALVVDFLFNYLKPEQLPFCKIVYFLRMRDNAGKIKTILHQATTLSVAESGKIEHVINVHTDVSHLHIPQTHTVSFISLNGEKSFFNMSSDNATFDPKQEPAVSFEHLKSLTKREIEIVELLSRGYKTKEISEKLFISDNTTTTHRKNLLKKAGSATTSDLVMKCLVAGII